jgi:putative spermidine/putrescine transport system ATP-binding protein
MVALALRDVTRKFGSTLAVDRMNLEVEPGEFICLLGPSGCGKSTALRMIAGFEMPDGGDILIDDVTTLNVPPNRRATSMVFQSHALWSHMTVAGNITFGLKLRHLSRDVVAQKLKDALQLVGLTGYDKRHPAQLSGGQQQRVALARSLVLEPRILLLDEPFSSLDAHLRIRLRDELKTIQRRLGLTMVFVTHDQEEAMSLADRIVVMNAGGVEQVSAPGTVYDQPATLFVAGFIGTMTMLPATLADGRLTAGPLRLPFAPKDATGEWTVALRPEDCALVPVAQAREAVATVDSVADLGATRVVTVKLSGGITVKVQSGRRQPIAKGDKFGLQVNRALVYRNGATPVELLPHTAQSEAPAAMNYRKQEISA